MPDDRLGYGKGCSGASGPAAWSLWAYDLEVGGPPERVGATGHQPNAFSWRADMDVAWFSAGSFICHGIAAVGGNGVLGLEVEVGQGATSFVLDDAFQSLERSDCGHVAWADQPTWSPIDVVAFVASPASVGMEGQARLEAPASIYTWKEGQPQAEEILSGVVGPRGLRWSPDGSRLAFGGSIGEASGTWVLRSADRALVRVAEVEATWLDWSPEGDELIAIVADATGPLTQRRITRIGLLPDTH